MFQINTKSEAQAGKKGKKKGRHRPKVGRCIIIEGQKNYGLTKNIYDKGYLRISGIFILFRYAHKHYIVVK